MKIEHRFLVPWLWGQASMVSPSQTCTENGPFSLWACVCVCVCVCLLLLFPFVPPLAGTDRQSPQDHSRSD